MISCDFNNTCPFLNKKVIDLPLTTTKLVENYCTGEFSLCTIYKVAQTHGIDKVPRYVSPDDTYELSHRVIELARLDKLGW